MPISRCLSISIDLCDPLNPGFGYALKIDDARTGEHTSRRPDTGDDLLSVFECLTVATWYAEEPDEQRRDQIIAELQEQAYEPR